MFPFRPRHCLAALICLATYGALPAFAAGDAGTAFPAAWPDQSPSIYSQPSEPLANQETTVEKPVAAIETFPSAAPVIPASFDAPAAADPVQPPAKENRRRLAPHRRDVSKASPEFAADALPSLGLNFDSVYTTGAALAVVLGVFFLCAALVRRGAKKANSRLPEEVVSVLGRVPLAARQFAELVRVGNKLVLVAVTPHGAEPLTEITDPAEIDRLVGLCRQGQKGSSSEEFDHIFRQLAEESAPTGFLGNEAPRVDSRLAAPADVYSAYRGARNA
jgi:flagellar biogenesis protein FliO